MRAILILSVFLNSFVLLAESDSCQFDFEGFYLGSSWAHRSERYAVFLKDHQGRHAISLLDAQKGEILRTIPLSGDKDWEFLSFDWEYDDSGFVILSSDRDYYCFSHYDLTGNEVKSPGEDGYSSYLPSSGLNIDNYGNMALNISAEGHPEIHVYNKGKRVYMLSPYPGSIWNIGWFRGNLYCISDMALAETDSSKIRRDDRGEEIPGKEKLYLIDIESGQVSPSYMKEEDIRELSFDESYRMRFISIDRDRFGFELTEENL